MGAAGWETAKWETAKWETAKWETATWERPNGYLHMHTHATPSILSAFAAGGTHRHTPVAGCDKVLVSCWHQAHADACHFCLTLCRVSCIVPLP